MQTPICTVLDPDICLDMASSISATGWVYSVLSKEVGVGCSLRLLSSGPAKQLYLFFSAVSMSVTGA